MTPRRAALATGAALLLVYLLTLAPGVTFWDAGEFIAAAHGFGIPHPPGTPLYMALGRAWIVASGWALGSARAMNVLSALCTALAGAITTWMVSRETRAGTPGAVTCGMLAGLMCSAWANATETEVYALALLLVMLMLASALRAGEEPGQGRWLAMTVYLIALAPAVHLSALIAAPAAIALAARDERGGWSYDRALVLGGALVAAAGVGRMSMALVALGIVLLLTGGARSRRAHAGVRWSLMPLLPLAFSALFIMLVRARLAPYVNQGDPATLTALADAVARRQYALAPLYPRQAPVWLQAANVAQYADWQVAMGWGRGVFTTPLRLAAAAAYIALGVAGWRAMRREAPRLAFGLVVLVACGTAGVAAYLNLKAGASLGWGVLPDSVPHEARERDYFFVPGFWAWGCLAGWGALAWSRRVGRPWLALGAVLVPLLANWVVVDRSRAPDAGAARLFAQRVLASTPRDAVLFTSGDNDTYPLWYLQGVEGVRTDVQLVTLPLLPADWYEAEIGRRTGWRWDAGEPVGGARWQHEQLAAAIARAARKAGRPVAASAALTARERNLLGSGWLLRGPVYIARAPSGATTTGPAVEPALGPEVAPVPQPPSRLPDDVTGMMLGFLDCPRLATLPSGSAGRDSLEVRCNFR